MKKRYFLNGPRATCSIGSISAAISSPVFVPPREESFWGRSAGSFPEQRLKIEPIPSTIKKKKKNVGALGTRMF